MRTADGYSHNSLLKLKHNQAGCRAQNYRDSPIHAKKANVRKAIIRIFLFFSSPEFKTRNP